MKGKGVMETYFVVPKWVSPPTTAVLSRRDSTQYDVEGGNRLTARMKQFLAT